jgi:hypothetical protein
MPGGAHENMKAWAPEEDHIILEMHQSEGPKWSKIVQRLPGRTISSVRNRWQRIEKGRKLREQGKESKNKCHACGQLKRGHVCYAKLKGGPQVEIHNVPPTVSPVHPARLAITTQPPSIPMSGVNAGVISVQPPLRHTRSAERLRPQGVVVEGDNNPVVRPAPLSVDIGLASQPRSDVPLMNRSNTSFFTDLVRSLCWHARLCGLPRRLCALA